MSSFLLYCLLLNHSFSNKPKTRDTNCFKLFLLSVLQLLQNYICSMRSSLFLIFDFLKDTRIASVVELSVDCLDVFFNSTSLRVADVCLAAVHYAPQRVGTRSHGERHLDPSKRRAFRTKKTKSKNQRSKVREHNSKNSRRFKKKRKPKESVASRIWKAL